MNQEPSSKEVKRCHVLEPFQTNNIYKIVRAFLLHAETETRLWDSVGPQKDYELYDENNATILFQSKKGQTTPRTQVMSAAFAFIFIRTVQLTQKNIYVAGTFQYNTNKYICALTSGSSLQKLTMTLVKSIHQSTHELNHRNSKVPFFNLHWSFTVSSNLFSWTMTVSMASIEFSMETSFTTLLHNHQNHEISLISVVLFMF